MSCACFGYPRICGSSGAHDGWRDNAVCIPMCRVALRLTRALTAFGGVAEKEQR